MSSLNYPPSPAFVAPEKLAPSAAFKKQVAKVVFAIILFFLVYILLVIASIALAVGCFYLGVVIITALANFTTVIGGLGLMAVGISVIFFLIKFIFAVTKNENPLRVEIKEEDQPELFEFVRKLRNETNAPFPKKIFVSPEVNASVFYNSSFWSMMFPVRKNLEIGLGLVNSINISELKAVIAHEFGHFSQRSMKLGSFTYNVNRIIYDMLYNNNSYTKFLNAWARLHRILSFFAQMTIKIAQGIQYVLRKVYAVINKSYLGLSREMEFHADTVAASAAGGNNVINGLSRIEIASNCYNTTLNMADDLLKSKKRMDNIFDNQLTIFRSLGAKYQLQEIKGLPEISFEFIRSFSTSRINYQNQWASHPELSERKAHLDALDLNVSPDESSAWIIFRNAKKLQEMLSAKVYFRVKDYDQLKVIDADEFNSQYKKENEEFALPVEYKGYYNKRLIQINDWDISGLSKLETSKTFDELFTDTNAQRYTAINQNYNDIGLLTAIHDKQVDSKSFDFDGIKYNREDCNTIIQQLEQENKNKQAQLVELDKEAFIYFNKRVAGLDKLYEDFKTLNKQVDGYNEIVYQMMHDMAPLYKGGLTVNQVGSIIDDLKRNHQRKIRKQAQLLLDEGIINCEKNEILCSDIKSFMQKTYVYYNGKNFINDELDFLRTIANQTAAIYNQYRFKQFKNLLEKQLTKL